MARLGKTAAINRLREALVTARALKVSGHWNLSKPAFYKWTRSTKIAIDKIFGGTDRRREFDRIGYYPVSGVHAGVRSAEPAAYHEGMQKACALLESMIEEIEDRRDDEQPNSSDARNDERRAVSNKVFVVHGRDEGAKQQAARTLEKLGLEPVILHEQPNRGKTIVEKFEDAAESAGFAVVLLTGDDEGGLRGDKSDPTLRARQNVIFELGYLSARLGRRRVCALVEDGVETPSDYDGVVYIPLDGHGAWRYGLVSELQAAGYAADANKLTGR